MAGKHPGFAAVQKKIAGQGHSMASAGAILAAASRGASKSAKKSNPRLNKVKGQMHEGGTIPETGTYVMERGEQVTAAPKHDVRGYSSEGSHPRANNPCKYHMRDEDMKNMTTETSEVTDHPFSCVDKINNQINADSPEMIRRQNSRHRDYRNGYKITGDGIYANPVSPSGKA